MQKLLSSGSLITFDVQMVRLRFTHHDNRTQARFSNRHFVSPIRLRSGQALALGMTFIIRAVANLYCPGRGQFSEGVRVDFI